nr:immunoglobulin heavy chain junction region [Macaca mulatta]
CTTGVSYYYGSDDPHGLDYW